MSRKMFRFFDPKSEVDFVRFFKPSLILSFVIPVIAIVGTMVLGLNWGIDFKGGTEMQVQFTQEVHADEIRRVLDELGYEKNQVQSYGTKDSHEMLIRVERMETFAQTDVDRITAVLTGEVGEAQVRRDPGSADRLMVRVKAAEDTKAQQAQLAEILNSKSGFKLRKGVDLASALMPGGVENGYVEYNVLFMGVSDKIAEALTAKFGSAEVRRVDFVDSQVSQQLRTDGALAVFYAILAILIYIAIRFDLFFAPGAVVCLIQDTFGAFLVFTFLRYEFDLPSVAALLTVVGVSINNTIVVYDRIRETLPPGDRARIPESELTHIVNKAVNDTLSRTINTALTVLFSSISLWVFAGGVIKSFAAVLTIGLALGAFSSTFAAPAAYLFMMHNFRARVAAAQANGPKGYSREEKSRGVV